jgi:hypothetical protein
MKTHLNFDALIQTYPSRATALKHTDDVLPRLKGVRPLDDDARLSLAAIVAVVIHEGGTGASAGQWAEKVQQLEPICPGLFLPRVELPEKLVWPMDELTGQRVENPWASDTAEAHHSRQLILDLSPALAVAMEQRAARGVSFRLMHEEKLARDGAAEAAKVRERYDEAEHKRNPWVTRDPVAMADIEKRNPMLAVFLKDAAKPAQPNCFGPGDSQNLTLQSRAERIDPIGAKFLATAAALAEAWLGAEIESLKSQAQRAAEQAERAERQLEARGTRR